MTRASVRAPLALLVTTAVVLSLAALPARASDRPNPTGSGTRDQSFGRDGGVRIPVPDGVRARQIASDGAGGWWLLAGGRGATRLMRVSGNGELRRIGGASSATVPGTWPIAMDVSPAGEVRILARTSAGALTVLTVDPTGSTQTRAIAGSDPNGTAAFAIHDAVWTDTGIVIVGGTQSDPPQPVIGIIRDGRLNSRTLEQPGSWGRLVGVAESSPGILIATGAGGYLATGWRGYPLVSFTTDLDITPGTAGGVMIDPREQCQFAMADVIADAQFNTVIGTTWGCEGRSLSTVAAVAQQYASLLSHDAFGTVPDHPGEGAVTVLPLVGLDWHGSALAVDGEGRIIATGTALSTAAGMGWEGSPPLTTPRPLSVRLMPDGDFDPSFAINDLALVNSRWAWTIQDLAIDAADRPLLWGTATSTSGTQLRLVRLLG